MDKTLHPKMMENLLHMVELYDQQLVFIAKMKKATEWRRMQVLELVRANYTGDRKNLAIISANFRSDKVTPYGVYDDKYKTLRGYKEVRDGPKPD